MSDMMDMSDSSNRDINKYCCVFRIGNVHDLVSDYSIEVYQHILYAICRNIYISTGTDIYVCEILNQTYYYCHLNNEKLSEFVKQVRRYRGRGVSILYGTQVYVEHTPVYDEYGKDINLMNLLLRAVIRLNTFSSKIQPVRRIRCENGQLEVYSSYSE